MSSLTMFKTLLQQMDPAEMAQHSTIDHHADGVSYLCLHRSPKLTAKIYLIEKPSDPNSGYLVHPHSHRYPFSSVVLAGALLHLRFVESAGTAWKRYRYQAEDRARYDEGGCDLSMVSREWCFPGTTYHVNPYEIHTLKTAPEGLVLEPIMIGLFQFGDEKPTSELYLPTGMDEVAYPASRQPSVIELFKLRNRCLELIK